MLQSQSLPNLDQTTGWLLILTALFLPLSITATDISMVLTAALCVFSGRFFRYWHEIKQDPLVWCALWIVLLSILGMIWSIAPWNTQLSALHKYSKLLFIPLLLPVCTEKRWRDKALLAFLFSMLLTVIISCVKAYTHMTVITHDPSPAAVFYTHIETSFLVAFATYLLALYAWKKPKWRGWCIPLIILFTYQEFFINDGRTGWIAYLVLLLLFAIQILGWKGLILGTVTGMILAVSLYYVSPTVHRNIHESTQEIQQYEQGSPQTSLGYRLRFDTLSWQLVKAKPILGYGTGSFATAAKQQGGVPGWKTIHTPHNEYLMMMVEFGIVGLLSLLLLFAVQWVISFRLGEMRHFAQGFLLIFMVSSLYNAFLYLSAIGHFYVLFSALFFAGFAISPKSRLFL